MFRWVSVKKLFFVLLAAIIALLVMFFVHGPYIEEGAEEAVKRALLERSMDQGEDTVPAEGHRFFQVTQTEDTLEVWGIFRTGAFRKTEGGVEAVRLSDAAPAKMTFERREGEWMLSEYREPDDADLSEGERKKLFPFHLRAALLFKGLFESDLERQMQAYAPD